MGYKAAAAFCIACLLFTGVFKYKDRTLRNQLARQDEFRQRHHQDGREVTEEAVEGSSRRANGVSDTPELGDDDGKRL